MDKNIELQPVYVRISQHQGESVIEDFDSDSQTESLVLPPKQEPPKVAKRCTCAKFLLGFVLFWFFCSGIATIILGFTIHNQMHQCLSPEHHKALLLSHRPCQVKSIDLSVVAGSVTIRSCPHAKNISIHVQNGAHSSKSLEQMEIQTSFNDGILVVAAVGPSFDWHHCQLSHITVTIPHHAQPNLHAHVVSGHIDVQGAQFQNLKLTTSIGYIKTHKLKVQNKLDIELFTGFLSTHDTTANVSSLEIENGVIDLQHGFFNKTSLAVGLGAIKTRNVLSQENAEMSTAIGAICAEVGSRKIASHVDYGFLRLKPVPSHYYFNAKSQWGVVEVVSSGMEKARFSEKDGAKEGFFGEPHDANAIEITTTYARGQLVFTTSYQMYD